jgi:hypothetical protein
MEEYFSHCKALTPALTFKIPTVISSRAMTQNANFKDLTPDYAGISGKGMINKGMIKE